MYLPDFDLAKFAAETGMDKEIDIDLENSPADLEELNDKDTAMDDFDDADSKSDDDGEETVAPSSPSLEGVAIPPPTKSSYGEGDPGATPMDLDDDFDMLDGQSDGEEIQTSVPANSVPASANEQTSGAVEPYPTPAASSGLDRDLPTLPVSGGEGAITAVDKALAAEAVAEDEDEPSEVDIKTTVSS